MTEKKWLTSWETGEYLVYDRTILEYFRACDLPTAEYLVKRVERIIKRRKATGDANAPAPRPMDCCDMVYVRLKPRSKTNSD